MALGWTKKVNVLPNSTAFHSINIKSFFFRGKPMQKFVLESKHPVIQAVEAKILGPFYKKIIFSKYLVH